MARLRQLALFKIDDGHGHASLIGRRTTYVARCRCGKPAIGATKASARARLTAHIRKVRNR